MIERTLVIAKPDAVARGLAGEVVRRLERRALRVVALRRLDLSKVAEDLYREWRERDFYPELIRHAASGAAVAMVVEGEGAVTGARALVGATDPTGASPGTLRGDLAAAFPANVVHASHDRAHAEREVALLFPSLR